MRDCTVDSPRYVVGKECMEYLIVLVAMPLLFLGLVYIIGGLDRTTRRRTFEPHPKGNE